MRKYAHRVLNSFLFKNDLDRFFHESSVADDGDRGSSHKPQNGCEGRCHEAQGDGNAEQCCVKLCDFERSKWSDPVFAS